MSLGFCLTISAKRHLVDPDSHLWPRLTPEHSSRQIRSLLEFTTEKAEENPESLPPLFQDVSFNTVFENCQKCLIFTLHNEQVFEN